MRINDIAHISAILVPAGPDVADDCIVKLSVPADLVITDDIPHADLVVTKGTFSFNPRGKLYMRGNIKGSLAMRGLITEVCDSGMITDGPASFNKKYR
jgi:uncharacterized protein YaiI (UPF0178 family)